MMHGVMKSLAPHKVFEGKAESWKEWKEGLEEFWELHHQGMKRALRDMVSTGEMNDMEISLGAQAPEGKVAMHALLRSLTAGRGTYSMEPEGYAPVPQSVRETIVKEVEEMKKAQNG